MTHYRSNLADVRFNLFEVFGRETVYGTGPWSDLDVETANDMLQAGAQLAESDLAASFRDDAWSVEFDPATGAVRLPESLKKSYAAYVNAEWWRMDVNSELGGIAAPPSLRWAMCEFPMGSNPSLVFYSQHYPLANILHRHGTELQKRIAEWIVDRGWGMTMVLTEADAGSAVGSAKTRAIPQPDGTWHIEGVKRFITGGDHDLSENIVHLVLARPVNTEGAGGPGTKGLSLFLVPKFHIDPTTGELGERNGVRATNLEKKMGLKASSTCEVAFGADKPAVGYLVGDVHRGIAQMFDILEYARMLVGTKSMATLSTSYLNALDFAKLRLQSPDLARRSDKSAPDVPIIRHPDVRRSLMTQKVYAEGMRALLTFAACGLDDIRLADHSGADGTALHARNDLLLPILKGFCSERAYALLADSLQTFGGSGYLREYPIEQYIRDAKIDSIYEGTTAIQGNELFFRKLSRDSEPLESLLAEIDVTATDLAGLAELDRVGAALTTATGDVRASVATLFGILDEARENPAAVYRIGLQTTRLLMMLGELMLGWLLARQALVARTRLESDPAPDVARSTFYTGKIATARFFASEHLPKVGLDRRLIESGVGVDVMTLPDEAF
ncbi:MAG TPA: acyl-CoA dehydrogenase [Sporichthya sp.]|nr:acyl-CoA dehydrogenase [Sporichthya sp.]